MTWRRRVTHALCACAISAALFHGNVQAASGTLYLVTPQAQGQERISLKAYLFFVSCHRAMSSRIGPLAKGGNGMASAIMARDSLEAAQILAAAIEGCLAMSRIGGVRVTIRELHVSKSE